MALGLLGKTDTGLNVCFLNLKCVCPDQDCMQSDCKGTAIWKERNKQKH